MPSSRRALPSGPLRIDAVSRLTGVAAATLRAWERRYGVPIPQRTASSYRLYGPAEVAEIERMRDLCADGVTAAQAARTVARDRSAATGGAGEELARDERAIDRILVATAAMDAHGLDRALTAAALEDPVRAFERVVSPALVRIGELWESGGLSVAHEHFASERVASFLRSRLRVAQSPDADRTVILACFDEEQHALALLAVALRFASWGMSPVVLGARTPPAALAEAVRVLSPSLVCLSVTIAPERRRARTLADAYGAAAAGCPWIVGGAAIESVARAVEAAGGIVTREPLADLHKVVRAALASGRQAHAAPRTPRRPRGEGKGRS